MNHLVDIAAQFAPRQTIAAVTPFGNGNINDTFLVSLNTDIDNSATVNSATAKAEKFVLQRINTQVFRQPQWVMKNMCRLTQHVGDRLRLTPPDRRWETPQVRFTQTGQDHWEIDGQYWRAISFIENTQSFDTMQNAEHAREIGYALGMFHHLISDLSPAQLADTLEGFHITPRYLEQYAALLQSVSPSVSPSISPSVTNQSGMGREVDYCLKFVSDRQAWAHVLENAKRDGKLPLRLMHGDPKVNNVMFDQDTGKAVSVIDLDTVKPGLVHYILEIVCDRDATPWAKKPRTGKAFILNQNYAKAFYKATWRSLRHFSPTMITLIYTMRFD
jgi:hypothetical protein